MLILHNIDNQISFKELLDMELSKDYIRKNDENNKKILRSHIPTHLFLVAIVLKNIDSLMKN